MNLFLLRSTASRLQISIISNYSYHKYLNPFIFPCSKETLREKSLYLEFSGSYFLAFRLNTEIHSRIQTEFVKIRTRKSPNTGIFYVVRITDHIFVTIIIKIIILSWNIKVQITVFTINCLRSVCDAGFRKKLQIKIPRVFKFSRWFKTKFSESLLK